MFSTPAPGDALELSTLTGTKNVCFSQKAHFYGKVFGRVFCFFLIGVNSGATEKNKNIYELFA